MPGVPEARPILGIDRPLEVLPAVLARDPLDGLGLLLDARRGAVELEEQRRPLLQPRLAVSVDRGDGQRVEQLGRAIGTLRWIVRMTVLTAPATSGKGQTAADTASGRG